MFFVGKCYGWKQGYSCFLKNIDYYCWRKEFLWPVGCSSRENSQGKTPSITFRVSVWLKEETMGIFGIYGQQDVLLSQVSLGFFSNDCPKKANTFEYFELIGAANPFANPFFLFLARTLISTRAVCNAPWDFQRCCEEPQQGKQQDTAAEGGIVFVWELLKICIQKAVTWVAFSQNLECKRILWFFNKTGEEWCHGRGFPGVWFLHMMDSWETEQKFTNCHFCVAVFSHATFPCLTLHNIKSLLKMGAVLLKMSTT